MPDRMGLVRLFGKNYCWHRGPGQPLGLRKVVPWPDPSAPAPDDLYKAVMRRIGGPLSWPVKEESGA